MIEEATITQLGAIVISILGALFSAIGAGFSIYKAKNIFNHQTKVRLNEDKISNLSEYFEGDIIIPKKLTKEEITSFDDAGYKEVIESYTVPKAFVIKFFFKNQHLFSDQTRVKLVNLFDDHIKAYDSLVELENASSKEQVLSTFIPFTEFAYELQQSVLDEIKITSNELSKKKTK